MNKIGMGSAMQNLAAGMLLASAIVLAVASIVEASVAITQMGQLSITSDDRTVSKKEGLPPFRL
jgi:hypothetical protein